MNVSMWARNLNAAEEDYLKKKLPELSKKITFWSSIAIIGPDNHPYINRRNSELTSYRVNLGGGQYIDEVMGGGPAPIDGKKNEVVWSINSSLDYLRGGADAIPFLNHPECENIFYFPNNYINKFIEAFSFADKALYNWHKNQSFLTKWFGAAYPDGKDSKVIMEGVLKILKN